MKYLSAAALFFVAQIAGGSAFACTTQVKTIEPGKLTVAVYDYPPFNTIGSDGSVSGIDPDMIKVIAAENCLEMVPLVMDSPATVQAVVTGKADVAIGSWNRTEKRSKVLGISAPTYLDPMGSFSKSGIDTIDGIVGKSVGTVTGYPWIEDLRKIVGSNLKLYPSSVALAQDLEAGRIDVGFDGYSYGVYSQKTKDAYKGIQVKLVKADPRVQASLEPAQACFLYTKGNESLGKALDTGIAKLHADGVVKDQIVKNGFDAALVDVGAPRLVK